MKVETFHLEVSLRRNELGRIFNTHHLEESAHRLPKETIVVLVESRLRCGRLFELQTIASAKFNRFSSKFFFSSSSLIFVLAQTLF